MCQFSCTSVITYETYFSIQLEKHYITSGCCMHDLIIMYNMPFSEICQKKLIWTGAGTIICKNATVCFTLNINRR